MADPDGERIARRVAEELLAQLRAGGFEAAARPFDDAMRRRLSPADLRRLWEDLGRRFGDLRAVGDAEVEAADGACVVSLRCHFEQEVIDLRVTVDAGGSVSGLFLRPAPAAAPAGGRLRAHGLRLLIPPLVAAGAALAAGQRLRWSVLVGAAGWLLALSLRRPAAALAGQLRLGVLGPATVAVSGPVEELVRLGAVLVSGGGVADAVWLGVGWGAVEVAFTMVVGMRQARRRTAPGPHSGTMAGAVERASAITFHVAAAVLLSRWWAAVAPLAVLHTGVNVLGLRVAVRSPAAAQAMLAIVAGALLATAILVVGSG